MITDAAMNGGHYLSCYTLHMTLNSVIHNVIFCHDHSNASNSETQKYYLWITRYIHHKLILVGYQTQEQLKARLRQAHVPLPFTIQGILSLLTVFVYNELNFLFSNEKY